MMPSVEHDGDNPSVSETLRERFGHDGFLPLQKEVIGNVLAGRDSLVLMPTGSGKSLCYQLPALLLDGLTLVVSPLIALMKDQVDALRAKGIGAGFINSTMTAAEIRSTQIDAYHGRIDMLYVAPERLALPRFRDFLRALKLSLLAIDEAHCISEWGHDFRPDYRNLRTLREEFPAVPVVALTATATERVREDIAAHLRMPAAERFVASFNRPNLTYHVRPKRRSFEALLELLRRHRGGSTIVYRFSRQETEELASKLSARGFEALPYHAGLQDDVRRDTQERFLSDDVPIIVATIAFGMGVDKPNIRLVAHYDLPKSIEGYYQETGRAGRDGQPSDCVLFYGYGDRVKQRFFIKQIQDPAERGNAEAKLAKMVEYGDARSCRRAFLISYFGEEWPETNCGACDVCLPESEAQDSTSAFDGTTVAQMALSALIRTGERFGVNHVVEVLRGSRSKRVLQYGHDRLSVHGIARETSADDLKDVIDQLIEKGLAARATGEYPTLFVTQEGRGFLGRRDTLTLQRRSGGQPPSPEPGVPLDEELFEKLRALRRRLADELGAPAFVVFGDATLREMASLMPQTHDSLQNIRGVGEAKIRQFGDQFISAIAAHAASGESPTATHTPGQEQTNANGPPPSVSRGGGKRAGGQTYIDTREMLRQGMNVAEIASRRGLAQSSVLGHLERLAEDGERLDLLHVIPESRRYQRIVWAFRQADSDRLKPVRDLLGERYSYAELRLVRLHMRQSLEESGGRSLSESGCY